MLFLPSILCACPFAPIFLLRVLACSDDLSNLFDLRLTHFNLSAVTSSSPLFAVDCEMCLTDRNILELTHVAVVDEKLRCVFNSHVKPEAKIINYLTQYSGVTARDMANPGVLTVKQVQMYVSHSPG